MNLPTSFFNLNSAKKRVIISGVGVASFYGWLQYTSPETLSGLLNFDNLMADPLNPLILAPPIVAAGGVLLPKLLSMKMPSKTLGKMSGNKQKASAEGNNKQYLDEVAKPLDFAKGQGNLNPDGKDRASVEGNQTISQSSSQSSASANSMPQSNGIIASDLAQNNLNAPPQNESRLSEMIENKTGRITEEVESVKKDMVSLKDDIQTLKTDIKDLTSTFESSLVELKAFQSEMVNPVNFMRKYFELLDIKSVSDPVNAMMPIEQLVNNNTANVKQSSSTSVDASASQYQRKTDNSEGQLKQANHLQESLSKSGKKTIDDFSLEDVYGMLKQQKDMMGGCEDDDRCDDRKTHRISDIETYIPASRSRIREKNSKKKSGMVFGDENTEFIRTSIESGLTPGKIMSIVSIVDEILASMGPDGIDLVLEQYKAIGLKPEEERLIYGVVKMLNESKLLTDDIIAMLYRFGQVLGINDEDAELQYMKIVANKRNKKKRISRDLMTPKGDE